MQLIGAFLHDTYNIGTIKDEGKKLYSLRIPHYQRPYKWTNKEVSNLIKDWKENLETIGEQYFAGSLLSVAAPNREYHSLIDGQQRVTTLFLANYVNFLLLKRLIIIDIERQRCSKIVEHKNNLEKCVKFLFSNKETLEHFDDVKNKLKDISDEDLMKDIHQDEDFIEEYQADLWISKFTDEKKYKEDLIEKMRLNLSNSSLYLNYDRESYNLGLKKVLSQFIINFGDTTELSCENLEWDLLTDNEKTYATSLETILNTFKNQFPIDVNQDIYAYVRSLHGKISCFLEHINVCVIQTSNTEDAYKLFEVMNDRSLALDDLDLIKNQFFKKYVITNTISEGTSEQQETTALEIDALIQKLDEQWGDNIFNNLENNKTNSKLIAYFATVFLSKSQEIKNDSNDKFREYIADYLSRYNDFEKYNEIKIKRDFNIFQICAEIVKLTKLPVKKKEQKSLEIEYNLDSTDFLKTLFFLNANDQDAVSAGLVNFLLSSIQKISSNFDIAIAIKFIENLIKPIDQEKIKKEFNCKTSSDLNLIIELINNIHTQSRELWSSSMMSEDYKKPRKLATTLISNNHLDSRRDYLLKVEKIDLNEHKESFDNWLKN